MISIILGTFLRASLLILYPVIALFIAFYYRFRITASFIILLALAALSFVFSFMNGWFIRYKLLSLFYMVPLLLLLFSNPVSAKNKSEGHLRIFMLCLAIIAAINDVIGFGQMIRNPKSDDSFIGLYSQFSLSLNGLMLLNTVVFYYYFSRYLQDKTVKLLIASLFFLASAIFCFYGAGVVVAIVAFVLSFFRMNLRAVIKTAFITAGTLTLIYFFILYVRPAVLDYNIANMKKLASFDPKAGPRKVTSFYNYFISYPRNVKDFLFGSGPGTFNSRSAFMIGSPSYFTALMFIKDDDQPYYFKNFAYTLWNENNTIQALYLDGFRNQPFSSVLAFLGEYGLFFSLAFASAYYFYFRKVSGLNRSNNTYQHSEANFRTFKFIFLLLPMLFLIDNYFEYPEIMLLMLIGLKLAEREIALIAKKTAYAQE